MENRQEIEKVINEELNSCDVNESYPTEKIETDSEYGKFGQMKTTKVNGGYLITGMSALEILEKEIHKLYEIKRFVKKKENIFKGEMRFEKANVLAGKLDKLGIKYNLDTFNKFIVITID